MRPLAIPQTEDKFGAKIVNLALQFPSLLRLENLLAARPVDSPHAALKPKIGRDTDLAGLADTLNAAVLEVGWPWLSTVRPWLRFRSQPHVPSSGR